jgi:hypothetical protein
MVGVSLSLLIDRQGKCPQCIQLIDIKATECRHCGYQLTEKDLVSIRAEVDDQFKRSALVGFCAVSAFLLLIILFFY